MRTFLYESHDAFFTRELLFRRRLEAYLQIKQMQFMQSES